MSTSNEVLDHVSEKPLSKPDVTPPVKSEHLPKEKRLTKELVLAKSKAGSLVEIKKIVLWGQKITECSIVTEIPELEVASMTGNLICSLEHFGQCPNLRELYLRNNQIRELSEIYHLKDLPNLQILWLAGNPCAKHPRYRASIVRNLEQLTVLDDKEITQLERESCETSGDLFEEPPVKDALFDVEQMQPARDEPLASSEINRQTSSEEAQTNSSENDGAEKIDEEKNNQHELEHSQKEEPESCPESVAASVVTSNLPGSAAIAQRALGAQMPGYALNEVRTAVLRLVRLLDTESLQLVQLTINARLAESTSVATTVPTDDNKANVDTTSFETNS